MVVVGPRIQAIGCLVNCMKLLEEMETNKTSYPSSAGQIAESHFVQLTTQSFETSTSMCFARENSRHNCHEECTTPGLQRTGISERCRNNLSCYSRSVQNMNQTACIEHFEHVGMQFQ
jgi:hypothetical protein